jgi:hypothetical protein
MTTKTSPTKPTPSASPDGVLELSGNPARDLARSFNVRVILFLAIHIPLVFVLEAFPVISTVFALLVLAFGIRAALLSKSSQVIYAVAYIAGAEVLWRMTRATIPWEFAKYATVVIIAVAILVEWGRARGPRRLRSPWPVLLIVVLLPGALFAILENDLATAIDALSFNLGSYAALIMLALYFWGRAVDTPTATRMLLALIAPILSITTLAIFNTATFTSDFLLASNWVTSGNYGPNQVSNVMGLAALACVILAVLVNKASGVRGAMIILVFVFLSQAMLTFSRGGVYSFVIALAVFGLHTLRTQRSRGRFLLLVVVGTALLVLVIFPWLNNYTGGALAQRLAELDSTGRVAASEADLQTFLNYPIAGVGVGRGAEFREANLVAHTEYTRLLAEHGLFGIAVLLILGWMLLKRYVANAPGLARGIAASFAVWSLSVMVHSALRIEVIPFALALAFISWRVETAEAPVEEAPLQPAYSPRRVVGKR